MPRTRTHSTPSTRRWPSHEPRHLHRQRWSDRATVNGCSHALDDDKFAPCCIGDDDKLDRWAVAVWVGLIFGSLLALAVSLKLIIWVAYGVAQFVGLA